jgi:tetratricopeptide (TPR) repeat protein
MSAGHLSCAREAWLATGDGETGSDFGMLLVDRGLYADAELVYAQLESKGYVIAWWCRAWSAYERGDLVAAEAYMREYIDHDDESPEASAALGIWQAERGAGGDAEELLRRGADVDQDARAALGNLLREDGRLDEAEQVMRVGYDLGEEASHIPLALILEATDRRTEAITVLREGYERGDAFCAFNLAALLDDFDLELAAINWYVNAALGGDLKAVDLLAERGIEPAGR